MKKSQLSLAAITISLALTHSASAELKVKVHESTEASKAASSTSSKPQNDNGQKTEQDEDEAPISAINRFGKGDTVSERYSSRGRHGVVDRTITDETGTARIEGETVTGETRSRTYTEKGLLKRTVGAQYQASLVRSRYAAGYDSPSAKVGDVEVLQYHNEAEVEGFVGVQADAEAGFDLASTDPRAEMKAGVFVGARVDASASQSVDVLGASASTTAEGSASVGAEAAAEGSLSKDGAEAKVGAFAGARAEGTVGGEVGGVGAKGTGEAWAGVGAEADAKATFKDGKLTLGSEAGAAVGVGGKVGYETTLDVNKVHHDGRAFVNNSGKLVRELDSRVTIEPLPTVTLPRIDLAQQQPISANQFQHRQTERLNRSADQFARTVSGGARRTTTSTAKSAQAISRDVHRMADDASRHVTKTGRKVESSLKKTAKSAGSSAKKAGKKATKSAGKAAKKITKKVKNPFK